MSARAQTLAAPVVRAAGAGQGLSRLAPSPALTSLVVGPANDEFEREADRSAEYVMSIRGLGAPALPSPPPPHSKRGAGSVQRACACGGKAEGEGECEECAKARLQRKAMDGPDSGRAAGHSPAHAPAHAPPMVHDVLRSPGRALDAGVRAFMEPRFGHDFGSVRVHTGEAAARSARSVSALAYTAGEHVVFNEGQYQPETEAGRRLLAHELAHVIQQSSSTMRRAQPSIMRAACGHDGKGTGCGAGGGVIRFPKEIFQLDKAVVEHGLTDFGGKWLTEVQAPPNPAKSDEGKDGGRIDGVRVSEAGGLKVEVAEIKPRSPGALQTTQITGGCAQASREARGYVDALRKIGPKIQTLSEKFSKIGGFRMLKHHTPESKAEENIFKTVGVDIADTDWFNAWRFYNSIQNKWPTVFTKAFGAVEITLFTQGAANTTYRAIGWPLQCDDGSKGAETLYYQVNNDGGVSYGCEKSCRERKPEPDPEPKGKTAKPGDAEVTAALRGILAAKETLAGYLSLQEGALAAQRELIYKPSAIGFAGYWTNVLFNKEPPSPEIWDQVHMLLSRVDRALKMRDPMAATAALMRARRAYLIAFKKFTVWKEGIPGAAAKMQVAIGAVAALAIAAFVAPAVVARIRALPPGATQTLSNIAKVIERADGAISSAEALGEDIELVLQAEEEAEAVLEAERAYQVAQTMTAF